MQLPDAILDRRYRRLEQIRKRTRKKLRLTAILRTILFIALLAVIIYFASELKKPWFSMIAVTGFSLFYWLIRYSGQLRFFIGKMDGALIAIRHEKERLARKKDSVYRDPELSGLGADPALFQDLDLAGSQGLVRSINTTFTRQGEKLFLANLLRTGDDSFEKIRARQTLIRAIAARKHLVWKYLRLVSGREKILKTDLHRLEAGEIVFFRNRKLIRLIFRPLTVLTAGAIVIHALSGLPVSSPFLLVNLIMYASYRRTSLHELSRFEAVFTDLSIIRKTVYYISINFLEPGNRKEIRTAYARLEKTAGRVNSAFAPVLHFLLNLLFLWDLWNLYHLEQWYARFGAKNRIWLDELAYFDSLVPFALLKTRNPQFVFPDITRENVLSAREMKHLFLSEGSGNDVIPVAGGQITIITGSNMAGKTTYLRTLGINTLLALCGGPVAAAAFTLPWNTDVYTSIRNSDSMEDGVSLFYAEVKRLAFILNAVHKKEKFHLVLLDEILKGTNSRERFIASKAVLTFLQKTTAMVFITTHDIELARLFTDTGASFRHFAEEIRDGRMFFDYKIREGIVHSSNALKIMEMEGLTLDFENG